MEKLFLLHQMGKVGSTALLRMLPNSLHVLHTHVLNHDRLSAQVERELNRGGQLPNHIHRSYRVRSLLFTQEADVPCEVKMISGTREPVERNISAYFQNIGEKDDWPTDDLIEDFLSTYPHDLPIHWFDWEIRDVFGLDVYRQPFPHSQGYCRLASSNLELLIIRLENLTEVVNRGVVAEFVGCELRSTNGAFDNRAEDKTYASAYSEFKDRIKLPRSYLDMMYTSDYSRHFYTDDEIKFFYRKWSK